MIPKNYEQYIKKAVKNGYRHIFTEEEDKDMTPERIIDLLLSENREVVDTPIEMLFNLECAKAFWGVTLVSPIAGDGMFYFQRPAFEYHLQKISILTDKERFEYLKKGL